MNRHLRPASPLLNLLGVLRRHALLLVIPTVVCTVLAAGYAFFRAPTWEASQTVLLRNEAVSNSDEVLGRFRNIDDLKLTQETVLEVALSHSVLESVLREAGRPASGQDVADLRDNVSVVPPDGAEFGKTELFYIKVRDRGPESASHMASLLALHLQEGLQRLRSARAGSVTEELQRGVLIAQEELETTGAKLSAIESQVGGDLADLRMLDLTATGDSDLRRQLTTVQDELRAAETLLRAKEESLDLLLQAQNDPGRLLAMPTELLAAHPGLARLKDGLVAAQLKTADMMGLMSENHPLVKAALEAEQQISRQLHAELAIALRGGEVERRLTAARVNDLNQQRNDLDTRLGRLATLRANYSTLATQVKHRTLLLEQSQAALSTARTAEAAAASASQISLIDSPIVGNRPVGPSRGIIVIAGFAGGLMLGAGLLFLLVPAGEFTTQAARAVDSEAAATEVVRAAGRQTARAANYNTSLVSAPWPFESVEHTASR